jgi:hypothetical protein
MVALSKESSKSLYIVKRSGQLEVMKAIKADFTQKMTISMFPCEEVPFFIET